MANDKIVDFQARKQKQLEEQQAAAQDPFHVHLPEEIITELNIIDNHVQKLSDEVDSTLLAYSDKNNGPLDFSIPLEALTRELLTISAEMDAQVLPEVIESHRQMRIDISDAVNKTVQEFTHKKDIPVYSQDLYIGVGLVLLSYLQQHRIFSQVRSYDMKKDAEANGGTNTPSN